VGEKSYSGVYRVSDPKRVLSQPETDDLGRFGFPAMLLEMIPFLGIFFTFTNTVGAALWAADIEKSRGPTEEPQTTPSGPTSQPSDDPPAYDDIAF
jgi:hypothetical protein